MTGPGSVSLTSPPALLLVDGRLVADPAAPRAADDDFGAPSSVALVAGSS